MPRHDELQRQLRRRAPVEPIAGELHVLLLGESDPVWQFALVAEYLRGELVGVAEACGVGSMAEDVAAEVIATWCRRVVGDPPVTFATGDAVERLRAGLLVSVRNAAVSWYRHNHRMIVVDDAALAEMIGADPHDMDADLFDGVDAAALSEALSRLDPVQADVARLVGAQGLSIRQASARLGVSKSTVAETWVQVQAVLRGGMHRHLTGGYCREVAPHLALLDAQRRATWAGLADRPLDDAVGPVEAGRVARHVYGDPECGGGGCAACRRTRTRERTPLGVFVAPPLFAPAAGVFDQVLGAVAGGWNHSFGAIGRLVAEAWEAVLASGASVGVGGVKVAALFTALTVAVTAPTVVPVVAEHPRPRPVTAQETATRPHVPVVTPRRRPQPTAAASRVWSQTPRGVASRAPARRVPSASGRSVPGGASAEFTPGP